MDSKHKRSNLQVPLRDDSHRTKVESSSPAPRDSSTPKRITSRTKKQAVLIGVAAIIVLVFILVKMTGADKAANADTDKESSQPTYQTVLPTGKTAQQLGGWQRVSPDDKDPVFAYSDTIGSVRISVSQQQLPSGFSGDDGEKLAELAKRFSATKKLTTAEGIAYIGTSAKGPQSVILAKGNTLVLIKSQAGIDDQAWIAYIDSLGLSF